MAYVYPKSNRDESLYANHTVAVKLSAAELAWLDERRDRGSHGSGKHHLMDRSRDAYGKLTRSSLLRLLVQAAMKHDSDAAMALGGFLSDPSDPAPETPALAIAPPKLKAIGLRWKPSSRAESAQEALDRLDPLDPLPPDHPLRTGKKLVAATKKKAARAVGGKRQPKRPIR